MDMEDDADLLLARIKILRDDLDAGRLTPEQIQLYRQLGRKVHHITYLMETAADVEVAEALWWRGAELIRSFLDTHFPSPTRH